MEKKRTILSILHLQLADTLANVERPLEREKKTVHAEFFFAPQKAQTLSNDPCQGSGHTKMAVISKRAHTDQTKIHGPYPFFGSIFVGFMRY
jgi:hypothetical protein